MSTRVLHARQWICICCSFGICSNVVCSCLRNKLATHLSSPLPLRMRTFVDIFLLFSNWSHLRVITLFPLSGLRISEINLKGVQRWGKNKQTNKHQTLSSKKDSSGPLIENHPFLQTLVYGARAFSCCVVKELDHPAVGSGCAVWTRDLCTQTILAVNIWRFTKPHP